MRKVLFTLPLLISVAFFSVNNLSFAEPPKHGGGESAGHAQGNPGGHQQGPQGGAPGNVMHAQGGSGQGMHHQGMPGHQGGQEGNKGEHRMMGMGDRQGDNMNPDMQKDNFDRADRNNDGDIGPKEAMRADQIQDQKHDTNMAERKHDMLDKNNDGNIGPRERTWAETQSGEGKFSPSSEMQNMADRNEDGLIDQFEKHQAKKHFEKSQGSMDTPPVKPAAYESGLLASSQNSNGFSGSEGAYASDSLFERADKNNDGALGPAERKMAREHMERKQFDGKGDRNHNGQFDRQERERAKDVMNEQRMDQQPGHNQMENKFGEHKGFQERQNGEFGRQEPNGAQGFQGMNKGPQNGNLQGGQGGPGGMRGGPGGGSGPRR